MKTYKKVAATAALIVIGPHVLAQVARPTPNASTAAKQSEAVVLEAPRELASRTPAPVTANGTAAKGTRVFGPRTMGMASGRSVPCADSLRDQATASCGLQASSTPTLGMLMPLSADWFIEAGTGNVGLGTTSPTAALDVDGAIRARSGGIEFPDGSFQATATNLTLPVEDQSQDLKDARFSTSFARQTFIAGLAGPLHSVSVNRDSGAAAATVNFYEEFGGSLLGTTSLSATTLSGWQTVSFPNQIHVTSGVEYSIELVDPTNNTRWFLSKFDPYPNGRVHVRTGGTVPAGWDMMFRTYVGKPAIHVTSGGDLLMKSGLLFPTAFGADPAFVGDEGNFLAFGHTGFSEDAIAYSNNSFYFHDSPGGGDNIHPNVLVGGSVGVGMITTPAFTLEVNGTAGKPGGGSWSTASDLRLKKNVADLDGALETLLKLRGVTFEYKDAESINELDGERIGFIAQEVEEVLPDWVQEADDGYKRLTIRGFEALAVEAFRSQADALDMQAARIATLERQVEQLMRQSQRPSGDASEREED